MKKILLLTGCLFLLTGGFSQSFPKFVEYLCQLPEPQRQEKADSFLNAARAFPVIEQDTVCHFIYSGEASEVSVAGDQTGWKSGKIRMQRIEGTSLWYATRYYPSDARIDYKFVIDDQRWILDPENPGICMGGGGPNSELRMPGHKWPPETVYDPGISHGTVLDTAVYSAILGNTREVKIYLPPGYPGDGEAYPVVLFHDGIEFIPLGNAVIILDNLIAGKAIRPVVAIFVAPVEREAEYAGNKMDAFAGFITKELMPVMDAGYRISRDPRQRATLGISNGGNISIYLGITHPEQFGKVAALSSSFVPAINKAFFQSDKADLEFYLDMGVYDIDVLIPMADNFVRLLNRQGYPNTFYKWNEGHSWGSWKGHVSLALKQFFKLK